jgi:hypothetical protein
MRVEAWVTFLRCGLPNAATLGHPPGNLQSGPGSYSAFLFCNWPASDVGGCNCGCCVASP